MALWSRIANTTIRKYIKQQEGPIMRNRKLTAMLQKRGRVSFNNGGLGLDWKVAYRRAPLERMGDMDVRTFSRQDRHKTAFIEYRSYFAGDASTKAESLQNKGNEAIIKVISDVASNLEDDIKENFHEELYVDGAATGNETRLQGLNTIFQGTSATAGYKIVTPASTYAGLTMTVGNYGGTWSPLINTTGGWPYGAGDLTYDFWSPLQVDYTNTGWQAATKTWPNTCLEALRFGIHATQRNSSKSLDLVLVTNDMFVDFLDALDEKERINVERNGQQSDLVALGFKDVVNYDGCDITWEYGLPQANSKSAGYGLSFDNMELCSQQGELFVYEGPHYKFEQQAWLHSVDFFGNLKVKSPAKFFRLEGRS